MPIQLNSGHYSYEHRVHLNMCCELAHIHCLSLIDIICVLKGAQLTVHLKLIYAIETLVLIVS